MSKIQYKHLDLSGATLVQRRHKRQVAPPGMWAVTNMIASPSDKAIGIRPDLYEFGEDILGLSGYENGVITQNFDETLDILNSAAGIYGSRKVIYFGTYAPFGLYDGDYRFLSDSYTTGKAIADSGSYDVKLYDVSTINIKQKTWRGAAFEINGDGRYHIVDEVLAADDALQTATIRLRAPTEADYNANEVNISDVATYKWTASGGGTNEYYCELLAGGDPSLTTPPRVTLDGADATEGTVGALADHEWGYGDGDTLGYSTIYFADATGDPDGSGVALLAGYGYDYALWYNHNPYRATDTKLNIQTGDSSSATSIIYCSPTFKDGFSARDVCGPFHANVTEGEWTYGDDTESFVSSGVTAGAADVTNYKTFATNGTTWMGVDSAASLDETFFKTTTDIKDQTSWTSYAPNDVVITHPQPNTDDVMTAITLHSVVRNATKGYLVTYTGTFSSVLGGGTVYQRGVGWTADSGVNWTFVSDENYSAGVGTWFCTSAWHDGTTLTALFVKDSDSTVELRYSTNNGTTWNNTTGENTWTANSGTEFGAKIVSLASSGTSKFVACGGGDNIYYSSDGQAFTAKDISSDVAGTDGIIDIAYNNSDGGTPRWLVLATQSSGQQPRVVRSSTTISGTYSNVTPGFELSPNDIFYHIFYDPIGSRFIAVTSGVTNNVSYVYSSVDYGTSWRTQTTESFSGADGELPSNIDWSGQLLSFVMRGSVSGYRHTIVLGRDYYTDWEIDLFQPLSEIYRSTTVANLDGYVVLIGCSDWDASGETWDYHPRRIRWSVPATYNDFASAGSGTADLKGTGSLLYALPANGRIVIFETNTVGALVPRGDTDDPWDYDVVSDNFKILSNPVAVGEVIYVVGFDGLLNSCDGIGEPREIGASFDLTKFDDFDQKKPAWLVYSREYNSLICYYRDSSDSTHQAQMINISTGSVSEINVPDTGDATAKSDQPISVVVIEDAATRATMFSYPPNSADADSIMLTELKPNKMITGTDTITNRDVTYQDKFYGTVESGELYITQEGEKSSVKHVIVETYTDASYGTNADTPYLVAEAKSIEDSDFATSGDTVGTATLSTTDLVGVGTAWSNTIAINEDHATIDTEQECGSGKVEFTLPCLASQARVYIDDVLYENYTTSSTEITCTVAPASSSTLKAYWANVPEVKVKVGDFFKSTEGWHRVTRIDSAENIILDHYLSTGSETVTHYPAWQLDDGHGRVELGINRLVEGVQIRLYLIPDYDGTQQSTIAKITGLSIGYVPQGRKLVKATGS